MCSGKNSSAHDSDDIKLLSEFFFTVAAFLLYKSATTETIECSRTDPGNSYRWTRSPDGSAAGSVDLSTSSNRYTINGRSLSVLLSNITGEDGGLYRCVYGDNSVTGELCIEVFGESKSSAN